MRGEMQWIVFLVWFFSTSHRVVAHVALTFPPARKYDLDFLDNSRTHSPCGMPKSSSVTTLPAGASFNVTWHLAYPHKGGFKLELLDQNERLLTDLTPTTSETNYVGSQDTTAQSYTVTIPKTVSCKGCTIRLLRQAREWGRKYLFWSCGDVDIVPVSEFQTICSGRGKLEEGHCSCKRLYSGNVCQYRDECWSDDDCGLHGKCINLKSTTFPKMQCFCETGWFGEKCDKESSVKTTNLDLSKHFQKNLSDDYTLYWRILQDREEIEIILKVNGTSYAALGWRPRGMNAGCKAFPLIREIRSTPSEPETNDKTTIVECITAAPDTTDIPEDGSKIRPEPHLVSSATLTTEVLKTSKDTTTITPHAGSKTVNPHTSKARHPLDVDKNGDRKIERVSTASTVLPKFFKKIFDFEVPTQPSVNFLHMPHSLLSDRFSGQPYYFRPANIPFNQHFQPSWSRNWPSLSQSFERSFGEGGNIIGIPAIDSSQNGAYNRNFASKNRFKREIAPSLIKRSFLESAGKYPPKSSYTPRHDFHPMDCTDMVIGAVRRGTSRIFDSYTRDRSTPRTDSYYGGTDDLTAAVGYEENGLTTIVFRKKLKGKELTDHTIENSFMDVIWARGQEIGKYIHRPKTGLEDCKVKTPDFYRPDEIKYHGHGKQRGKVTMNFFDANSKPIGKAVLSTGEWKYPQNCKVHSCLYHVKWKLRKNSDEIEFIIYSSNINKWTGIGFSNNTKMTNSDAIIGWVNDIGQVTVIDTWLTDYEHPQYDVKQDIHKFSGEIKDGIFKLQFNRKINTGDDFQDLQFSSQNCLYFLYPVKGGTYNSKTRRINVHEQPPMISTQKICINHISGRDADQKPKSELDVKSEPEPTIVTDVQTEFESTSEPVVKPEPETTSESNVKYEPEPTSEPNVKSEPDPRSISDVKSEFDRSNGPAVKSKPKTPGEEDIKSETESNVEQDIKSEPASSDESGLKTGSKPSSEPSIKSDISSDSTLSPEPTSEPEPVPQPPTQSSIEKEETENTHEFPSSSTIPHQSVGSSSTSTSTTTIITTKTTPRTAHQEKKYNVQLKLAQPWKNELERVDSDEHRRLREEILNKVSSTLKSIKEFEEIKFDIFKSNDDAENKTVLVRMVVTMLGKKPDENECNLTAHHLSQLSSALSETVSKGYIDDLRVDPAYLIIQPVTVANVGSNGDATDEGTGPMELPAKQDITVYIIVAGFMALLFLIGLQVFVMFWRDRKRRRRTKTDRPKDCQCAGCKGLHRKCIQM
ncbi:uncharacterized protein LOC143244864 isoform X2 [Tachypleus tridentatus]|uniref:uncharacterized protein LOC143244864 isoform X2 n=1 Tax=Tachypleus tridentatus TaxID=6853 RepID=UPI003FD5CC78